MRRLKFITLLVISFCHFSLDVSAQDTTKNKLDKNLIQFSGLVMTADSLMAIPYVNIYVKRTKRGVYSDFNGYFTFVAEKGDTVTFSCLGFKNSKFIIPDTIKSNKYSMVKLLTTDTVYLDEAIIRPLPLREMFDYVFVKADIPDDDMERARKNLERQKLKESSEKMNPDGAEAGKSYLARNAATYYYKGQIPPNNLLNPFAWAQFFEAWKRGDFKKQEKTNYEKD